MNENSFFGRFFSLSPARIAILYLVLGFLWIGFSDQAVLLFFQSPESLILAQTIKGWFYVSVTGLLLFFLVQVYRNQIQKKEDQLVKSYRRFKALTQHSNDGILMLTDSGEVVYYNPSVENIFKIKERKLTRPTFELLMSEEAVNDFFLPVAKGREKRTTGQIAFFVNGKRNWVNIIVDDHRKTEGVNAIVANINDITDLKNSELKFKRSEERYRQLFEFNPLPMFIWDVKTGDILEVNLAAIKKYGYTRMEFKDLNMMEIRPAEERERFIKYSEEISTELPVHSGYWKHLLKDGSEIIVETTRFALKYQGTRAEMVTAIDRTKEFIAQQEVFDLNRTLEDKVNQRTSELKAVNEELKSFSYSVSHDLRSPIRTIDGFSQALIDMPGIRENAQALSYTQRLRSATDRMRSIVDDLLNLSRVSRSEFTASGVNLSAIAEEILHRLQQEEPREQTEINIEPGMTANSDEGLIRILMENLLSNAWKFTKAEEVTKIAAGSHKKAGKIEYFIRDNGTGFRVRPEKLFRPFQRFHSDPAYEGTGIGLAIVRRIINRHGGSIRIESKPGSGCTVFFTLSPVHKTEKVSINQTLEKPPVTG